MPKYKIPVTCEMYGTYEVEADSLQEAIDKYESEGATWKLPELDYVDSSEHIEHESVGLLNEELLTKEERKEFL